MKKIKTLFRRDPEDRRYVLPEVEPGCEWVVAGEGVATRKYDGTCVMYDGVGWWARREVKPGKQPPSGFRLEQHDDATGKNVGWEPAANSPFAKFLTEALEGWAGYEEPGTYELIGPKINGNPENYARHALVLHEEASVYADAPRDYDALRVWLHHHPDMEGVVWHHPDGRMAKIKRRDFMPAEGSE